MITVRVRRYDDIWDAIEAARKRHSYSVRRVYREAGRWCVDVAIFESITNG
jgi:hypothetical protein